MKAVIDRTGQRIGRLTVVSRAPNRHSRAFWNCRCDCGSERVIDGLKLTRGQSSCGCLRNEQAAERATKHGGVGTSTYGTWEHMVRRCRDPKSVQYKWYGAAGVTVADRWLDFAVFLADMGERPSGHTIERDDNAKGYEPGNCRWATPKQQSRNRRSNRKLTMNGETLCLAEWAERAGVGESTIRHRLSAGWTVEAALTTGVG